MRSFVLIVSMLFALLALMLALPGIFKFHMAYGGMSDNGIYYIFMVVMMFRAARKDSQFLITRPIARRSAHLAILTNLFILAAGLAASLVAVQLIGYSINKMLANAMPRYYSVSGDGMLWNPFYPKDSLLVFWNAAKNYVAIALYAYGYACFFTRWRGWTIALTVGIPVLLFVLFVLPTIQAFISDVNGLMENSDSLFAMVIIPRWINITRRIVDWFRKYFNVVLWSVAAAMIPFSFAVMRTTRHTT